MIPTNQLRFIKRNVQAPTPMGFDEIFGKPAPVIVRVLQQWWTHSEGGYYSWYDTIIGQPGGEWRDVPLEQEAQPD